jgi:hypothetical protein
MRNALTRKPPNIAVRTATNFFWMARRTGSQDLVDSAKFGAPRLMKMGTMHSQCLYDAAVRHALQSANLRRPALLPCVMAWGARPLLAAIMIQETNRGRALRRAVY